MIVSEIAVFQQTRSRIFLHLILATAWVGILIADFFSPSGFYWLNLDNWQWGIIIKALISAFWWTSFIWLFKTPYIFITSQTFTVNYGLFYKRTVPWNSVSRVVRIHRRRVLLVLKDRSIIGVSLWGRRAQECEFLMAELERKVS